MRKLILTALIAATALPGAAFAQSGDYRRDRADVRQDQRDQRGDRRDLREDRRDGRDGREDRRDYRADANDRNRQWGRDDWRGYRTGNRAVYARGSWQAPFRYQTFRPGGRIQSGFYGQRYWISDPWRYRLPAAGRNQRWVRHYDDVLLIDIRRGIVADVIRSFYW